MSLNIHYYVVYTPVLFIEILGDLKKFSNSEISKREVQKLAKKISAMDSCFTANYRILLYNDLMGNRVNMDYRPVRLGGQQVVTKAGEKGIFFDEEQEHKALRRWLVGQFSEAEKILSESWRRSTRALDLQSWQKLFQSNQTIPKARNYNELLTMTEEFIGNQSLQLESIQVLLSEVEFTKRDRNNIFNRWLKKEMPALKDFAPYAFYCLKVFVAFYLGIANRLIGTKPTNRIDLEYLLYVPFCRVLSSTDKFLREFGPCFLNNNQDFVWGNDLKADLKRISEHWRSLTDNQKCEYRDKHGCYPPERDDSITYKLWRKYMGTPRERKPLTPEREKEIMKRIQPYIDSIKQARRE